MQGGGESEDVVQGLLKDYPSVRPIVYYDDEVKLTGYVSEPTSSKDEEEQRPKPCVLVAHTAIGPQEDFILQKVKALSEMGYVAFAVDMFGAPGLVLGEDKVRYNAQFKQDRPKQSKRIRAALRVVSELECVDEGQIAGIGYCMGGTVVLDLMRSEAGRRDVKGVVSFHGILDHPTSLDSNLPIQTRVLVFHGHSDPFITSEGKQAFMQEMEKKNVDWQLVEFGGCVHAFTRPDKIHESDREKGLFYNKYAADKSWALMTAFLNEIFDTT